MARNEVRTGTLRHAIVLTDDEDASKCEAHKIYSSRVSCKMINTEQAKDKAFSVTFLRDARGVFILNFGSLISLGQ